MPADRRLGELASRLRERLARGLLPGPAAHALMAPRPRPRIRDGAALENAAVLALLYPLAGEPSVVLTARAATLGRHASQVSFPGGRCERGEPVAAAALREAAEELDISPGTVQVLGTLSPVAVAATAFLVHPVLGWTPSRPRFRADPAEVAALLEVRVRDLLAPQAVGLEIDAVHARQIPYYGVGPYRIWGATAMILCELLALLREPD